MTRAGWAGQTPGSGQCAQHPDSVPVHQQIHNRGMSIIKSLLLVYNYYPTYARCKKKVEKGTNHQSDI